jgi:uncharacterized membrane protein
VADRHSAVTPKSPGSTAGLGPRPRLPQREAQSSKAPEYEPAPIEEAPEDEPIERPWRSYLLMAIGLAGIGVSIYVTILHYAHIAPICSDSGAINCTRVLTSPQSVFLGIPVPLYGLAFFIGMFVLSIPQLWWTKLWWIPWLRLVGSAVGILFALRLIYEELFVIRNLCLWCTGAHVLAFFMFIVIVTGWEDATRQVVPRRAA